MSRNDFKFDQGKLDAALPLQDFPRALKAIAAVGAYGNQKYEPHSWPKVEDAFVRYSHAMLRHYLDHMQGEKNDPETLLRHYAHFAWNALATLELLLRKEEP